MIARLEYRTQFGQQGAVAINHAIRLLDTRLAENVMLSPIVVWTDTTASANCLRYTFLLTA
jgi:hypothetical protein